MDKLQELFDKITPFQKVLVIGLMTAAKKQDKRKFNRIALYIIKRYNRS